MIPQHYNPVDEPIEAGQSDISRQKLSTRTNQGSNYLNNRINFITRLDTRVGQMLNVALTGASVKQRHEVGRDTRSEEHAWCQGLNQREWHKLHCTGDISILERSITRAQYFAGEHYLYLNQTSRGDQDNFIIDQVREMRSKCSSYTATL